MAQHKDTTDKAESHQKQRPTAAKPVGNPDDGHDFQKD